MRKTNELWPVALMYLAFCSGTICLVAGCSNDPAKLLGPGGTQPELKFKPQVVIRRAFPAIVQPKTVSAKEASESVHAEELVLGVEVDGVARAYPINMLTGPQREIINDKLGGKAIAATW